MKSWLAWINLVIAVLLTAVALAAYLPEPWGSLALFTCTVTVYPIIDLRP